MSAWALCKPQIAQVEGGASWLQFPGLRSAETPFRMRFGGGNGASGFEIYAEG
jgi:hypothetical protein